MLKRQMIRSRILYPINRGLLSELSANHDYTNLSTEARNQLDALGNVYYDDRTLYFQASRDSRTCARHFMTAVVNDNHACQLISASLMLKQQNTCLSSNEKVWPNCISIVTASLKGEKICFVALSGKSQDDYDKSVLMNKLDELANNLNKVRHVRQDEYHYAVIKESSAQFKSHLHQLTGNVRDCAEYDFGAMLAKLYEQHGEDFRVEGIVNCAFYPFENNLQISYRVERGNKITQVKQKAVESDIAKKFFHGGEKFSIKSISKIYQIDLMPCCQTCQDNKDAFMCTLMYFQQRGKTLNHSSGRANLRLSGIQELSQSESSMFAFFHRGESETTVKKTRLKKPCTPSGKIQTEHDPDLEFEIEFELPTKEDAETKKHPSNNSQACEESKMTERNLHKRSYKAQNSRRKRGQSRNSQTETKQGTQSLKCKKSAGKSSLPDKPAAMTMSAETESEDRHSQEKEQMQANDASPYIFGIWCSMINAFNRCCPNHDPDSDDEYSDDDSYKPKFE